MKIIMVGAGAVGGFLGARLVKAGVPCSFLLRAQTLAAVRQKGLSVHSVEQSFTVHPIASDNPRDLPPSDLIILAVKRYDLDEVIAQLRPILLPHTTVLTLQNGVDTEVRIREMAPGIPIIGGVAYIYSRIAAPGVIEHYKRGAVGIGSAGATLTTVSAHSSMGRSMNCEFGKSPAPRSKSARRCSKSSRARNRTWPVFGISMESPTAS